MWPLAPVLTQSDASVADSRARASLGRVRTCSRFGEFAALPIDVCCFCAARGEALMTSDDQAAWLECELCIVGAGHAGLNGLNAAAGYLKKGARVVVIDKNQTWGGQWLHQYDFLRLHQPYGMFTAGAQPWKMDRDPLYLATRREVLDHLTSVPAVSGAHLDVRPFFGHAYTGHQVREGSVELVTSPVSNDRAPVRIRAKRLLLLPGAQIEILRPLALRSTRVHSLAVSDPQLNTREFLDSDAPVYIVGGGKTAVDCALHLIRNRKGTRRINVINGSGMWYLIRDRIYPGGKGRYYNGVVNGEIFMTMCKLYDGQNEPYVMEELARKGYVHKVWGDGGNFRTALLSRAERAELRAGVDQVYRGHLVDVEGTRMTVRQGQTLQQHDVPEGAYIINCTSHIRQDGLHQPIMQDSGLVCAPQFVLGLPGVSAYFITHLWFRNELGLLAHKFYRMHVDTPNRLRFVAHFTLMIMANIIMVNAVLPAKVFWDYKGDFNKWYPFYRRVPTIRDFIKNQQLVLDKAESILKVRFSDSPDRPRQPMLTEELQLTAAGA
jgi:hypothetical protein